MVKKKNVGETVEKIIKFWANKEMNFPNKGEYRVKIIFGHEKSTKKKKIESDMSPKERIFGAIEDERKS